MKPKRDDGSSIPPIVTNSVHISQFDGDASRGYSIWSTEKVGSEAKRVQDPNRGASNPGPQPNPRPKTGSGPATVNKSDQRFQQRKGLSSSRQVKL
jgi:hypothetical protein